ncbi:hypothetical protein NUW54_g1922 [Trametes sanguinea]|uniref:Uncharacterized protein n=1 Tax=Trametes sanguinea TaxID=158606 RepID=A0ACC1Q6W2_9APHY|nr:hypothetical protein NUW54_g1922 [Trametes sanguinea]
MYGFVCHSTNGVVVTVGRFAIADCLLSLLPYGQRMTEEQARPSRVRRLVKACSSRYLYDSASESCLSLRCLRFLGCQCRPSDSWDGFVLRMSNKELARRAKESEACMWKGSVSGQIVVSVATCSRDALGTPFPASPGPII